MDKQPIAVILTDTHLSESNMDANRKVFEQTIDFCVDNGISTIFHGGDIFHSRKSQSQAVLSAFEQILDEIVSKNLKMISIVGNHDKTDYRDKASFLSPFKHHPGITLFEEYHSLKFGELDVHFCSYFDDDIYIDLIKAAQPSVGENSILLTHIGVEGAVMNSGLKIESGVKTSLFKNYKQVYIGHYHDGQSWKNINYIGASMQHNFGERSNKGLQVLYNDGSIELCELDFPEYIKFEVDIAKLSQRDLDDLKAEKEESNNFIRVVLVGEEKDLKKYNVQSLKQIGIDVQLKLPEIEIKELEHRIEPFTPETLVEQFKKFCEENHLPYQQGVEYFNKIVKIEENV